MTESGYAELQVTTNFSFLRGASHPEEIVAHAKALGLAALAITDRNTLAGVVRAHTAAKDVGLRLIVGARLELADAPSLLCLPTDRQAYGRLSRLLSLGQMRAAKGECVLRLADVAAHAEGQIFIALPPQDWDWREALPDEPEAGAEIIGFPGRKSPSPLSPEASLRLDVGEGRRGGESRTPAVVIPAPSGTSADGSPPTPSPSPPGGGGQGGASSDVPRQTFASELRRIKGALGAVRLYLAVHHTYRGDDRARLAALAQIARRCGTPLVACGDVLYHAAHRRPLADVLACVREGTTVAAAGRLLEANAERHLKPPREMARLFKGHAEAVTLYKLLDRLEYNGIIFDKGQ